MLDLAPITRHLRAKAGSHLLVAAVHHLGIFEILSKETMPFPALQERLSLSDRSSMVLFPALCAMGMIRYNDQSHLELTHLGLYLTLSQSANLTGYLGLDRSDPGVLQMAEWLMNDGPQDRSQGVSYVKDEHADSPMDEPGQALFFTMALAGRAKYLSPLVAEKIGRRKGHLLDVAGGTGYYTFEWLKANPESNATIVDTAEVLKVSKGLLEEFCKNNEYNDLRNRISFLSGDMLTDLLPRTDILLAASLFHDWPEDTCRILTKKFAAALRPGGELWVHDSFLDDTIDGPLAVTDYSAMLFIATKGRNYSRKEYRKWFVQNGLFPSAENIPTLMDYGLISARKPD